MEKFNLLRFLDAEGRPTMLCMMCKRYSCKTQTCPGDDNADSIDSGGFECPYFTPESTPISDSKGVDILADIECVYEDNVFAREARMDKVLCEILKQLGYSKTVEFYEKQNFQVPF